MRNGISRAALMAALLLAVTAPLKAQSSSFAEGGWWLGYAANAPRQLLGAGTAFLWPQFGGWGLYGDVKVSHDAPARGAVRPDADSGDDEFGQRGAWRSVNVALVKVLGPEFALYAGGGLGDRTMYVRFTDTATGIYWVEDDGQSGRFANGMAGMFFRLTPRFVFQMGAETAPSGFTAGMHIVLR